MQQQPLQSQKDEVYIPWQHPAEVHGGITASYRPISCESSPTVELRDERVCPTLCAGMSEQPQTLLSLPKQELLWMYFWKHQIYMLDLF